MHHTPYLSKTLSLVIIVTLLTMRLAFWSEELFVIPITDAIFHNAFFAAEEHHSPVKALKLKVKQSCEIFPLQPDEILPPESMQQEHPIPLIWNLIVEDISNDIFIPPEAIS